MRNLKNFTVPIPLPQYPKYGGLYALIDENCRILYIGSAKQLCRRVSHLTALQKDKTNSAGFSHIKAKKLRNYQEHGHSIFIRFLKCKKYRIVEQQLIKKYEPPWNIKHKRKV